MRNLFFALMFSLTLMGANSIYTQDVEGRNALYKALVEQDRNLKDDRFKNIETSPLAGSDIENFESLEYFEPNPDFKVEAEIEIYEDQDVEKVNTTNGNKIELVKFGKVTFQLMGKSYSLVVYRDQNLPELSDNPGQLFIPFKDKTSGNETNKDGRYLTFSMPEDGTKIELDFNLAFNPYSAYNNEFESVVPPDENFIEEVLMTGERKYEDR